MEFQYLHGHKMTTEVVPVTLHSSSWNMDYESTELFLVCECGERMKVHHDGSNEQRLLGIEHAIRVLGKPLEPYVEQPADRWD